MNRLPCRGFSDMSCAQFLHQTPRTFDVRSQCEKVNDVFFRMERHSRLSILQEVRQQSHEFLSLETLVTLCTRLGLISCLSGLVVSAQVFIHARRRVT